MTAAATSHGGGRVRAAMSVRVEAVDGHRRLFWPAVVGLTGAAALAVFGLPPVDLHGPLHHLGVMDPFCGGTRALRAAARGQLAVAWRFNPLSVVLFVGATLVVVRAAVGVLSGRWVNVRVESRRALAVAATFLLVALEASQLHASLLMGSAAQSASWWSRLALR